MSGVRIIFPDAEAHWLRLEDGEIVARGDQAGLLAASDGETRLLVAPARDVSLHALDLPNLAPAQARAAAQLALAEKSLLPADQLHISCGAQGEDSPARTIALVSCIQMQAWIEAFDPDVIVPAPLLLPQPDEGYVRAILGDEVVLRGVDTGFAADTALGASPILAGAILGGAILAGAVLGGAVLGARGFAAARFTVVDCAPARLAWSAMEPIRTISELRDIGNDLLLMTPDSICNRPIAAHKKHGGYLPIIDDLAPRTSNAGVHFLGTRKLLR